MSSSNKKNLTYSQKKRAKMDYRKEYFKRNPGLFGCIWTCAYCKKPLIGKKSVVVDHIVALNNVMGQNAAYNLVASCERCNLKKSDTVNLSYVTRGFFSKAVDSILFTIQRIIIYIFVGIWYCIWGALKALATPLRSHSISVRILTLGLYAAALFFIVSSIVG